MQANSGLGLGLTVGVASLAINYVRSRALDTRILDPPVLEKRPKMVPFGKVPNENRGEQPMEPIIYLEDPYYYVRDDTRKDTEILDHLKAENEYTKAAMKHLESTQGDLYKELLSHVQETDTMVPYPHGDFLYYSRTEEGKAYRIHCRKPREGSEVETVLLNVNELAEGQSHCNVGDVDPSPDHKTLAYSVDFTAYETYDIYIKDLASGKITKEISGCNGTINWGADATTLFYTTQDAAHRSHKIWSHRVGSSQSSDTCWYTENDEMFSCGAYKTCSGQYMVIESNSKVASESRVMDLHDPSKGFVLFAPRAKNVKYSINHWNDDFLLTTNRNGDVNFKLMSVPCATVLDGSSTNADWESVFPYDPLVKVSHVYCFRSYFVLSGRQDGLTQRWICKKNGSGNWTKERVVMAEAMYSLGSSTNKVFDSDVFRFTYSSLTTPVQTLEYNTVTKETKCLKETPVPNYDRSLYHCERVEVTAQDGTIIPTTLVYRKDLKKTNEPQPLHLYGYGSYEISIEPNFRATILPLLDRGVIFAIAHIRGGGENGRTWYESAKYLSKINTFTDFIACAEELIAKKFTSPQLMSCEGRSAGGLLMGAVLNMRPDLFKAAIAGVPFVDVMNTISDATIPLTTGEWAEWGNPNEMKYFQYMLQYSPYENVKPQDYPAMLITGGLFDPRVPYWEPTKWVARLREMKTDSNKILLKMDMEAGHFSASDRYHFLKEKAIEISFLLDLLHLL